MNATEKGCTDHQHACPIIVQPPQHWTSVNRCLPEHYLMVRMLYYLVAMNFSLGSTLTETTHKDILG